MFNDSIDGDKSEKNRRQSITRAPLESLLLTLSTVLTFDFVNHVDFRLRHRCVPDLIDTQHTYSWTVLEEDFGAWPVAIIHIYRYSIQYEHQSLHHHMRASLRILGACAVPN